MVTRRINDRQVERLLQALHSREYRQQLAARLADDRIAAGEDVPYKTAYNSAMRRLQRYVTESTQTRQFSRSSAPQRQVIRQAARAVPAPPLLPRPRPEPRLPEIPPSRPAFLRDDIPAVEYEGPRFTDREQARELRDWDYQAIVAYHDGDADEAAQTLGVSDRAARLLELAASGEVSVLNYRGSGELVEPVRDFFENHEDADDVEDFVDLLANLPDWHIGIILEDMKEGRTTFADWLDAWHDDGMIFRHWGDPDADDLEDSAYWEVWREAYARAKA